MTTVRGSALDITTRKIQDIISCLQTNLNKELKERLINQLFDANTNQAYYAAMVVALKTSNTIDKIIEEIQHPSFIIPDATSDHVDTPSVYTTEYQPQRQYDYTPISIGYPPAPANPEEVRILTLQNNSNAVAKIVIPFYP